MTILDESDRVARGQVRWIRCPCCASLTYLRRPERNHRARRLLAPPALGVRERLELLLDEGSFAAMATELESDAGLPR